MTDSRLSEADVRMNGLLDRYEDGRYPLMYFIRAVARAKEELGDCSKDPELGRVVVACFAMHTEGRDLMSTILGIVGFEVTVVERYTSMDRILELCSDPEVTALCVSVQATYDLPQVKGLRSRMDDLGLERVVLNVGGSPVSE